jgi:hypothetical protein
MFARIPPGQTFLNFFSNDNKELILELQFLLMICDGYREKAKTHWYDYFDLDHSFLKLHNYFRLTAKMSSSAPDLPP